MNIELIRKQLNSFLFCDKKFLYVGSRGLREEFVGRIIKIYPRTFLISTKCGQIKSFSYSDFAIHALKILPIKEKC